MVNALIRMKLVAMRRSSGWMRLAGLGLGLLVAYGVFEGGWSETEDPTAIMEEFALAFGAFGLAWLVLPLVFGREPLRPEYFALLPVSSQRLTIALFAASFVGVLAPVTLFAFAGLVVYGARLGAVEGIVALVAILLLLALVAALSRVVVGLLGEGMKSRVGRELVALQFGILLTLMFMWPLLQYGDASGASDTIDRARSAIETTALYAPSGWAPLAVDAAAESNWWLAGGLLLGLAVVTIGLLAAWARLTVARLTTRDSAAPQLGAAAMFVTQLAEAIPATPSGGVARKEMVTWLRDPWRALELRTAIWTVALLTGTGVFVGVYELVPFIGVLFAVWGVICSTNLYGLDGSAVWQTIVAPGGGRADVRGRQLAWLIIFGPISVIATVVATIVSGAHETWAWTLSALPTLLGGGAGVAVVVSLYGIAPLVEPHKRSGAYDSAGDNSLPVFITMVLAPLLALPGVAVVAAAYGLDIGVLQWLGIPVGVIAGVAMYRLLGNAAASRLERRGPELLLVIRSGTKGKVASSS